MIVCTGARDPRHERESARGGGRDGNSIEALQPTLPKEEELLASDAKAVPNVLNDRLAVAHAAVPLQRQVAPHELSQPCLAEYRQPLGLVHAAVIEEYCGV